MQNPEGVWAQPVGMLCPHCRIPLTMTDRQGIEIDYCLQCRGVWLDRGELDKLIQQVAPVQQSPRAYQQPPQYAPPVVVQQPDVHYVDPHHAPVDPYHDPHRRRSFLEDIFGGHHERDRGHH